MWNINERFSQKAIESLAALGFSVGSTRGVVRVEKYGCGAEFRKDADGTYQMTVMPTIMLKGQFTRLWDAGYQKFLLTDDGMKVPPLASHLANLRKFSRASKSLPNSATSPSRSIPEKAFDTGRTSSTASSAAKNAGSPSTCALLSIS